MEIGLAIGAVIVLAALAWGWLATPPRRPKRPKGERPRLMHDEGREG